MKLWHKLKFDWNSYTCLGGVADGQYPFTIIWTRKCHAYVLESLEI